MNLYNLTINISVAANIIANDLSDEDLELAAAVFSQLGDTLSTISVLRSKCPVKNETGEEE